MVKINASLVLVAGGCLAMASASLGQAPSTAQVWDVRFVLDSSGPYVPGPSSTQAGITMFGWVGILPNTSASGTNNFGVSRIGGAGTATSGFRVIYLDPESAAAGLGNGRVTQGLTADIDGRSLLDTNGNALAGHFVPFRGSFTPQAGPMFLAANAIPTTGRSALGRTRTVCSTWWVPASSTTGATARARRARPSRWTPTPRA